MQILKIRVVMYPDISSYIKVTLNPEINSVVVYK